MKTQSKCFNPNILLQKSYSLLILILFASVLTVLSSCSDDDKIYDGPILKGKIISYNEFGGAMVNLTSEDMTNAGFTLGDVLSITIVGREYSAPYYDGYYSVTGDYLFVAYPSYPSICFTANNIGLPEELRGLEGETFVVKMKEKGGKIDVQQALSMKYTNIRERYPSDESFANARSVEAGKIATDRLYRSSSPFSNEINRANYVSAYIEQHNVKTVLNLADTEEKMLSYNMPSYSRTLWESGNVILCPLKADPTATDFNNRLIASLKELPSHPAPYVVHCIEGKDRTGYVCALLEGLCGATYEEIKADYLKTYENYYFITPENDPSVCNALLSLRLNICLMYYAGIDDESLLQDTDFADAFSHFLLSHGMSQEQLDALIHALTATDYFTNQN